MAQARAVIRDKVDPSVNCIPYIALERPMECDHRFLEKFAPETGFLPAASTPADAVRFKFKPRVHRLLFIVKNVSI